MSDPIVDMADVADAADDRHPPAPAAAETQNEEPLRPVRVWRSSDALRCNEILNDENIRPSIVGDIEGPIDIGPQIVRPENIVLMGEHGFFAFWLMQPGIYEVHAQVLPEGRGRWAMAFGLSCQHWMFTRTPAFEILAHVAAPQQNVRALTIASGARFQWSRRNAMRYHGRTVDMDVYATQVQDWALSDPWIGDTGRTTQVHILAKLAELGGAPDESVLAEDDRNRFLGAAVEMGRAGNLAKAVMLYNRWAQISRQPLLVPVADKPPTVRVGNFVVRLLPTGIEIQPVS